MTSHRMFILNVRVTENIHSIAMILVTLKSHFLNGNFSLISASILNFLTILEWEWSLFSKNLTFISICTTLFFDINQLIFWLWFSRHFDMKYFPIKCFWIFIADKSMCKYHYKMCLNFKIGQEMTEKLNFENALA